LLDSDNLAYSVTAGKKTHWESSSYGSIYLAIIYFHGTWHTLF